MHVACFAFFLLQMGLLINSRLHPEETISSTEQKRLSEISFPVVFRICIKPAFNQEALQEAGYLSSWHYFAGLYVVFFSFLFTTSGCSKYSGKTLGWAGHSKDGDVFSSVQGKDPL